MLSVGKKYAQTLLGRKTYAMARVVRTTPTMIFCVRKTCAPSVGDVP